LAGLMIYREYQGPGPTLEGTPAPAFELRDESGVPVSLEDFRGKLVFLNFWATWCAPCVQEIPDMMALNGRFQGRLFQMLAVSVNTEWSDVEEFYQEHSVDLPTLLDPGRQASSEYRVFAFPETFLINGEGMVVRKFVGAMKWTDPQFIAEVENLLQIEEQRTFGINTQASR